MSQELTKKCCRCKEEKPVSEFNIRVRRGLAPNCKTCRGRHSEPIGSYAKNGLKKCCTCGEEKSITEFHKYKNSKDGLSFNCRTCLGIKSRLGENRANNGIKKCSKCQIYKPIADFRVVKSRVDGFNSNCKDCANKIGRETRDKNHARLYEYNRRLNDPQFKLRKNLRSRLKAAIKKNQKSQHTLDMLGCTIEEVKQHLEKQFTEGMTWKNHGKYGWHIDHIVPCSAFDLSDPVEQKQCFHYTNLQPLWWSDNLSKGNKYLV